MNAFEFDTLSEILDATSILKSDLKPSEWYEKHMVMPQGSAFPGPIKYNRTPFWREPVDCADPNHPARDITIMGPAQMGKSIMVLNPIVGYSIAQDPGNILFLTGHADLTKRAVQKIDFMIHNCDLSKLIRPSVLKQRNSRSGDTAMEKEFRGGNLIAGSITNHNLMRQNDVKKSIADDLDAGQIEKGDTGNTVDLIKGRTKAFENQCKRYWVSSPQIKGRSLIEMQFELSDKRYYNVPCPECHEMIVLNLKVDVDDKHSGGLHWELDNIGRVIPKSVGYVCYKCAGFFNDKRKHELLLAGKWVATCEPKERHHQGYGITGLYAPHGMTSWVTLAEKYVLSNPAGQPRDEGKYKTFMNIDIGEVYEEPTLSVKPNQLQLNIRNYPIGIIPEAQSIADGNGKIVVLTLAADLGGRVNGINSDYDDVRLDYEVIAHSETGSTYSVIHGSLGTFVPNQTKEEKENSTAKKWSYDINLPNNVWDEFEKIRTTVYASDNGVKFRIAATGIDTGFAEAQAFNYIDRKIGQGFIIGLKGDKEDKYVPMHVEQSSFKIASRANLYMVRIGQLKDKLMARINFKWERGHFQPPGFLNFPEPGDGKYRYDNYFSHYEAEHRVLDKSGKFIWAKKASGVQNHHFDVNIYNTVVKEILMHNTFKSLKLDVKVMTWKNFSNLILTGKI